LAEFERLAKEYNFEIIDATADVRTVFERLRAGVARVLSGEPREPLFSVPFPESAESTPRRLLEMPKPAKPTSSAPEELAPVAQDRTRSAEGEDNR
jgi:hypothetical protein